MSKTSQTSKIEGYGVLSAYQYAVDNSDYLLWRPIFINDIGIDGQYEYRENGKRTGKFINVQIKSGKSYFPKNFDSTRTNGTWTFTLKGYGNTKEKRDADRKEHLNYWKNANTPVILLIHYEEYKKTYWVDIRNELQDKDINNITSILIPYSNILQQTNPSELFKNILEIDDIKIYQKAHAAIQEQNTEKLKACIFDDLLNHNYGNILNWIEKIRIIKNDDTLFSFYYALTLAFSGIYTESINEYDKYINNSNDLLVTAQSYFNKAFCYVQQCKHFDAIKTYEELIERFKDIQHDDKIQLIVAKSFFNMIEYMKYLYINEDSIINDYNELYNSLKSNYGHLPEIETELLKIDIKREKSLFFSKSCKTNNEKFLLENIKNINYDLKREIILTLYWRAKYLEKNHIDKSIDQYNEIIKFISNLTESERQELTESERQELNDDLYIGIEHSLKNALKRININEQSNK